VTLRLAARRLAQGDRVGSLGRTLGVAVALGAVAIPAAGQGAKLYVVNQSGASITVIDQGKLTVDTTLDLTKMGFTANAKPHHVTVEPDGSFWYVTLIGDGKVLKLDRRNRVVGQVSMETPGLIMLDPAHDSLYVGRSMTATNPPKSLGVIARKSFTLVDQQEIQIPRPHALVTSRNGRWIFAGSLGENRFAAVETATGRVTLNPLPGDVFRSLVQFTVSPNGHWMIAGGEQSNSVLVFDMSQTPPLLPVKEFAVPAQTPGVGSKPWDPAFSPDGKFAYFSLFADSAVAEIDVATWTMKRRLAQGLANPYDVIVSHDGTRLFVVNQNLATPLKPGESAHASMPGMAGMPDAPKPGPGWLSVIDIRSGKVIKTLPLGMSPSGMGAAGAR
jgi:DNA-binding beta-propeller fold protein YncE